MNRIEGAPHAKDSSLARTQSVKQLLKVLGELLIILELLTIFARRGFVFLVDKAVRAVGP